MCFQEASGLQASTMLQRGRAWGAGLCLILCPVVCPLAGAKSCPLQIHHLLFFLQDLGITKVGHMKRILQAIKELSNLP